jgi:hypothetical protein
MEEGKGREEVMGAIRINIENKGSLNGYMLAVKIRHLQH